MPIQSISSSTFQQLNPDHKKSALWVKEEIEWFVERSRALIACLVRDTTSGDWSFVIEGRDERGQFHPVDSHDHIPTQEDARTLLEKRINELLATGIKVFPRVLRAYRA